MMIWAVATGGSYGFNYIHKFKLFAAERINQLLIIFTNFAYLRDKVGRQYRVVSF